MLSHFVLLQDQAGLKASQTQYKLSIPGTLPKACQQVIELNIDDLEEYEADIDDNMTCDVVIKDSGKFSPVIKNPIRTEQDINNAVGLSIKNFPHDMSVEDIQLFLK